MLTSPLHWWKQGRTLPSLVSLPTSPLCRNTVCLNPDPCLSVHCVLASLMADPVVMLSLYPEFPKAVMSSFASCGEFVFLMDCSGSMSSPLNSSKTNETCISSARVLIICHLINTLNIYQSQHGLDAVPFPTSF